MVTYKKIYFFLSKNSNTEHNLVRDSNPVNRPPKSGGIFLGHIQSLSSMLEVNTLEK